MNKIFVRSPKFMKLLCHGFLGYGCILWMYSGFCGRVNILWYFMVFGVCILWYLVGWWGSCASHHVLLSDGFFVVGYDYSGGWRVFFRSHSCFMYGFYDGVVVWVWANPVHVHFDDFANPSELKIRSMFYGKLHCVSCMGHVRGNE